MRSITAQHKSVVIGTITALLSAHARTRSISAGNKRQFVAKADNKTHARRLRDQLARDCGVIAVEMEGSGVADAAWTAGQQYLVIRGICDYCDDKKNDLWQGYAALASAAYARALISSISLTSYKTENQSKR